MELIHLIFVALFSFASSAEELYEWLGVPKTASSQEIKRAYKSLAKEWHPDKNDDPSATDRFTKINEAYETLKDPEKRANYDNYGYTSGQERQRHPGGGFHPFDEFFHGGFQHFGFGGRENNGMDRFLLNLREFETKYHPRTNQNPCFIYTYTDFCFNCMRIEPVVFKFMTELENVGMCVGAVHLRRSPGLASFLRLHNAPNILGVVDKRISTYKASGISFQTLRDFVKNLLPSNTLKLIKDDNFKDFLKGWKDNKVRAIFFGTKEDPSLRFLVPAFYHRDRIAFGYVYSQGPGVAQILKQYSINKYRESLLMWNEDTNTTMASITMQQLSRSAIDEVVSTNRYLSLPRLSSQTVFEELCPEEPKLKKRKLCVSLVTKNTEDHEMARNTFRAFAQQTSLPSERVKFSYMFEEVQHSFVKALTKGNETRSKLVVEVVIIWRFDTRRILYDFLEHGWNIEPELAPKSRQQLEDRLTQLLKGDNLLPYTTVIPEFYNEHMLGLFTRILYKLWDWSDRIYYYCTR